MSRLVELPLAARLESPHVLLLQRVEQATRLRAVIASLSSKSPVITLCLTFLKVFPTFRYLPWAAVAAVAQTVALVVRVARFVS
jgi:hypothetical protein